MRTGPHFMAIIAAMLLMLTLPVDSNAATLSFGSKSFDSGKPVEIVSDSFKASNQDGMAEFNGHVVVGQGDLRISADRIVVEYTPEADNTPSTINLIRATGNVTLVSGSDAAEAQSAVYELETSRVIMTGGVLLTSGTNSVSGGRLTISLKTGSASIEGRVKTVFQPGKPTK